MIAPIIPSSEGWGASIEKEDTSVSSFCGRRGDPTRTGDRLVPNQERYQLRYTPKTVAKVLFSCETAKFVGKKVSKGK